MKILSNTSLKKLSQIWSTSSFCSSISLSWYVHDSKLKVSFIYKVIPHLGYALQGRVKSSHPEVFLGKGVLKICSKLTGEHACRIAITIKLLCNFIEIALRYGCSPVHLPHISEHLFLRPTLDSCLCRVWRKLELFMYFFWFICLTIFTLSYLLLQKVLRRAWKIAE